MAQDLSLPIDAAIVERVLLHGDLRQLTPAQKLSYYSRVCASLGLNPLTKPFEYLTLNGKEILYARRECTEQLRKVHDVSLTIVARELHEGCYVVSARASLPSGRTDESTGAVALQGLVGESRANAMMKAETKAKRRVTLSICGLGMLDESEVDSLDVSPPSTELPPADDQPPMDAYDTVQGPPLEMALAQQAWDRQTPPPAAPPGTVRVVRLDSSPTKNPQVTRYRITLSDGDVVVTINQGLASQARQLCEHLTPVLVRSKQTQWGKELVGFRDPMVDREIPFLWLLPAMLSIGSYWV